MTSQRHISGDCYDVALQQNCNKPCDDEFISIPNQSCGLVDPASFAMVNQSVAYEAFRHALSALKPGWVVTENGLVGPGGARVVLAQRHHVSSEGHVDVLFEPDESTPLVSPLWDCVSGFGATPEDKARNAAYLWSQTTAGAMLEFKYSRRGEFADHFRGSDRDGFRGWHIISGAVMGRGGDSASILQQWILANPVLPTLSHALSDSIDELTCPHGIKLFMGGDGIYEVRVDGERHEIASAALANMGWPRLSPPGYVRSYLLVLHRETES